MFYELEFVFNVFVVGGIGGGVVGILMMIFFFGVFVFGFGWFVGVFVVWVVVVVFFCYVVIVFDFYFFEYIISYFVVCGFVIGVYGFFFYWLEIRGWVYECIGSGINLVWRWSFF